MYGRSREGVKLIQNYGCTGFPVYDPALGSNTRLDGSQLSSICPFGDVGEKNMGTSESVVGGMLERHDGRRGNIGWGILKNRVDPEHDD